MTGQQLRELMEAAGPRYYFSNLHLAFEGDPGDARASLALPDGAPVRDNRSYTVATNDFLADGGDGLALLPTLPREATGVTLLGATIEQLRSLPSPVRIPRFTLEGCPREDQTPVNCSRPNGEVRRGERSSP